MTDIVFDLGRNGSTDSNLTINLTATGAIPGTDFEVVGTPAFVGNSGQVIIPSGQASKLLTVRPIDQAAASTKNLTMAIVAISDGSIGVPSQVTATLQIPGGAVVSNNLVLSYDAKGDLGGIFYYLGSDRWRSAYTNPANATIETLASSVFQPQFYSIANNSDRAVQEGSHTLSESNAWMAFKLPSDLRLQITGYALQRRTTSNFHIPRGWKLQGSDNVGAFTVAGINAATWTDIDSRSNQVFPGDNWLAYTGVVSATSFQYFRLVQTQASSGGEFYFIFQEWEFYGNLTWNNFPTYQLNYSTANQGILHLLGTAFGNRAWTNPMNGQHLRALRSSINSGSDTDLTDRAASSGYQTNSEANAWIVVDLGQGNDLKLGSYSIDHRNFNSDEALRSWVIEGTNNVGAWTVAGVNAATWTIFDTQTGNATLTAAGQKANFVPATSPTGYYRYYRLRQTGVNSSGNQFLCIGELELYGTARRFGIKPVSRLEFAAADSSPIIDNYLTRQWTAFGGAAISGNTLLLDNIAKYIQTPYSPEIAFNDNFLWRCEIFPTSISGSTLQAIMGNAVGGGAGTSGFFLAISNSALTFRRWVNGSGLTCTNLVVNQWQEVIAVKRSGILYLSLNGVAATPIDLGVNTTPNNPFTVGLVPNNSGFTANFLGNIRGIQMANLN
jgi:hypothetical protein